MMRWRLQPRAGLMFLAFFILSSSCAGQKPQPSTSPDPTGGTTLMPASYYTTYYSTQKARALGETYEKNLAHLLTQLTQSSIGKLQFANPIVSLSVGFFTHAASQPPDERYLEAIIGMPDILEEESDFNTLVGQLFSQYGPQVLSILAQDKAIAQDNKLAGYGIHFSWRSMKKTPSGPHLTMREAVLYFAKDQVRQFLSQQLSPDSLLSRATLFSRRGEYPAEQVQYLVAIQQQPQPPAVPREENPAVSPLPSSPTPEPAAETSSSSSSSSLDIERDETSSSLVKTNTAKRQQKVRASKRKRGHKRMTFRRSSYNSTTRIAPASRTSPSLMSLSDERKGR